MVLFCQRGIAYAGNNMRKESSSVHQQEHLYDTTEAYLTYKVGSRDVITSSQQSTKKKAKTASVKRCVQEIAIKLSLIVCYFSRKTSEDKEKYPESRGLMSRQQHYA